MILREFAKHINKLVKEGHGNAEVVYSCDDEGNGFQKVFYAPAVIDDEGFLDGRDKTKEYVCIN